MAGAAPAFYTLKTQVPLSGGATLGFTKGKGYYAKPSAAQSSPQPDRYAPLSDADLAAAAAKSAHGQVDAQTAPITSAQTSYDAQQEQHRQAYVQLAKAAAEMMSGIGPSMQQGLRNAASDITSFGAPLSESVRAALASSEGANRDYVNSVVAGTDPSKAPDPQALKDTLYSTGALYPSEELEARGLGGLAWGVQQPGIALASGADNLRQIDQQIATQDAQFRQQAADVVAKYPQLYDQVMQALQGWEKDKASIRNQIIARQDVEKKLGLDTKKANDTANYHEQTLKLREQSQQLSLNKAIADGQRIDAAASRVLGYVVDHNGQKITDAAGNSIPVASKPTASDQNKQYGKAVIDARKTLGKPVKNTDIGPASPGRYLAQQGVKGGDVYPARGGFPATTNNPAKAQSDRTMNFAQAQAFYMDAYGLTRAQARRALIAAGWKPDGQRP